MIAAVTGQHIGLYRCAESDNFVRVQIGQRFLLKEFGNGKANLRHACGAAYHDHAFDVFQRQPCVTQGFARRAEGFADQGPGQLVKHGAGECEVNHFAIA